MSTIQMPQSTTEGLMKDPATGDYRVQPGYAHQALRYRIHEAWLDEEDDLWISGAAVERAEAEQQASEPINPRQ